MPTPEPCPCGGRPVRLWIDAPAVWRLCCPLCAFTTARQPTEAAAIDLWNEHVRRAA